ncbi:hypothetical protein [Streptomyces sp. NPDC005890]|uniref:hypothetical protein n=1 Tax=Streptomyces sp. NPDC005890 TaxID=3154568 RepID=UPI0033ECE01D
MTSCNGTAVLLVNDGRQFDTEADLTKDSSGAWRGTLTFHDQELVPVLLKVDDGHLLIDGKPGEFIRPDRSDWTINDGSPSCPHPRQRRRPF